MAVDQFKWGGSENLAREVLSLPMGPHLPSAQVEHVIKALRSSGLS